MKLVFGFLLADATSEQGNLTGALNLTATLSFMADDEAKAFPCGGAIDEHLYAEFKRVAKCDQPISARLATLSEVAKKLEATQPATLNPGVGPETPA